jgi:hypothetical protein
MRRRFHAVIVLAEGAGQEHVAGHGQDASGNLELGDIGAFLKQAAAGRTSILLESGILGVARLVDGAFFELMPSRELRALEPEPLHQLAHPSALQGELDVSRERSTRLGGFTDRAAHALCELAFGRGSRRVALGIVLGLELRVARLALLLDLPIELATLLLRALFHGQMPRIVGPRLFGSLIGLAPQLARQLFPGDDLPSGSSRPRAGFSACGFGRISTFIRTCIIRTCIIRSYNVDLAAEAPE